MELLLDSLLVINMVENGLNARFMPHFTKR